MPSTSNAVPSTASTSQRLIPNPGSSHRSGAITRRPMLLPREIPRIDSQREPFVAGEVPIQATRDVDRTMPAAGAADADRHARLAFGNVARNQEVHHVDKLRHERCA